MALQIVGSEIWLIDACAAEEALELVDLLLKVERPTINLSRCTNMHAALLQTVLAYKPAVSAEPAEPFLRRWIFPFFASSGPA